MTFKLWLSILLINDLVNGRQPIIYHYKFVVLLLPSLVFHIIAYRDTIFIQYGTLIINKEFVMCDPPHSVLHAVLVDMREYQFRPGELNQLAELYCDIWPEYPWFEYMKCNVCGRYYSQAEFESGNPLNPCNHWPASLERAWIPSEVEPYIASAINEEGFIGTLLVCPEHGIIGFSWGFLMSSEEVSKKVAHEFPFETPVFYYSELAVRNAFYCRGKGYGKLLVSHVVREAKKRFPNSPSVLRTNDLSVAYKLFMRAGYEQLPHTDVNANRVVMLADSCSRLHTI